MTYVARNIPEDDSAPQIKELENTPAASAPFFSRVSPQSALAIGLITSIMATGTVGFIILLIIFIRGGR